MSSVEQQLRQLQQKAMELEQSKQGDSARREGLKEIQKKLVAVQAGLSNDPHSRLYQPATPSGSSSSSSSSSLSGSSQQSRGKGSQGKKKSTFPSDLGSQNDGQQELQKLKTFKKIGKATKRSAILPFCSPFDLSFCGSLGSRALFFFLSSLRLSRLRIELCVYFVLPLFAVVVGILGYWASQRGEANKVLPPVM